MNVTIRGAVTHLCPFKDERDYGTVMISYDWDPLTEPLELALLREVLDSYANRAITHEAMTVDLTDRLGSGIEVTSAWQTAGLEAEIG